MTLRYTSAALMLVRHAAVKEARHRYRYTLVTLWYTTAAGMLVRLLRSSQQGVAQVYVAQCTLATIFDFELGLKRKLFQIPLRST